MSMSNWDGENLRHLIGMERADGSAKQGKPFGGGLEDQQRFVGMINLALPPKEGLDVREEIDTRSQPLADEDFCELGRLPLTRARH